MDLDQILQKLEKSESLEDCEIQFLLFDIACSLKKVANKYGA